MLPGSASASSRAAMLTPSPKTSPLSTMISPRLTPIRRGDAPLGRQRLVLLCDRLAQTRGAARRLDDALELAKRQIAGLLEEIAAVFTDQRLNDLGQNGAQIGDPVDLVAGQQPTIAGDQDCRQPAPNPRSRHIRHDDCAPIERRGEYMMPMIACL